MDEQKGFTLIELMVTIIITAILVGITLSTYLSLKPKLRVNGAASQIQGDLMWARMQAVKQNNNFKVFFLNKTCNINEHQGSGSVDHVYQILDDEDGDGTIDSGETVIEKHIQTNYIDVTVASATADPIFHPRGNAIPGATIILSNSSKTKTVTVGSTGHVKID